MTRGKRTRLEAGLYSDAYGLSAVAKVGALTKEKRFPPETDLDVLRQWRARAISLLLEDHAGQVRQRADPRSLVRSIATYLRRRQGRVGYLSDRSHLKAWIPELGTKRRHQITETDIERVIAGWRSDGRALATIRHRVRVLRELFQALDGKAVAHPLAALRLPKATHPAPIPVARQLIRNVAASLQKGLRHPEGYGDDPILSRARFLVYATTGQRPAQIGRALPGDVDLERRIWFVRPAKGGEPIPLPLNEDMVEAWAVFVEAKAWGKFDPTSLAKVLRRHGWPKGIRPYQLRHTFAIDLLLNGVNLDTIQGLLGHASIQTTRQFYAPILLSRLQAAVGERRLDLGGVPPIGVPPQGTTPIDIARQSATSPTRKRTRRARRQNRKN